MRAQRCTIRVAQCVLCMPAWALTEAHTKGGQAILRVLPEKKRNRLGSSVYTIYLQTYMCVMVVCVREIKGCQVASYLDQVLCTFYKVQSDFVLFVPWTLCTFFENTDLLTFYSIAPLVWPRRILATRPVLVFLSLPIKNSRRIPYRRVGSKPTQCTHLPLILA